MTLLSPDQIAALINIPKRNTMKLIKSPGFPAPAVDLSQRIRRWTQSSIEQWVTKQQSLNSR